MHVIATAGHVDHGKSSLVRALTGSDPDRYAEEKRRGLTLDLGFAWTELPGAGTVAFVDVPGHERFVPTMLAGVGPVPVSMFVVAADGGWMPQSAEHLAALHALDVRHALLVVTRADLADPGPATARALAEIGATSLGRVPAVACSVVTGEGLDAVRAALAQVVAQVPQPDVTAPVRFWIDRSFTIKGAGTVVTGTLAAGSIAAGEELELTSGRRVGVRGVQSLEVDVERVGAVARVALNLRGVDRGDVARGDALLSPGTHLRTDVVDVRVLAPATGPDTGIGTGTGVGTGAGDPPDGLPARVVVHLGSAAVAARVRPLGADGADELVRLQLATALPLRVGDRLLLRDPTRHLVLGAAVALDVAPPALRRRGAATIRAAELRPLRGVPDEASEVARRGLVRTADLLAMGVPVTGTPVAGDWHADPAAWARLRTRLAEVVAAHARANPLQAGPSLEEARQALDLPTRELVGALVAAPLHLHEGRVVPAAAVATLPPAVARAVEAVLQDLRTRPFAAPDVERLAQLRLGRSELAAAVRAGRLERVAEGVVLAPGFKPRAAQVLAGLPQPFTVSQARSALDTSRRVALPLLAALDAAGITARDPDDRRRVRARS